MLTLRQIKYVLQVATCGSIAAASKELGIAQSSILAAIATAEKLNGVPIFIRQQGRGIAVTPAGQDFLMSAKQLLSAQSEFRNSLKKSTVRENSTLRIGCYASLSALLIPPVMKRIYNQNGRTEFILYEGEPVELQSWLSTGALDVVVTYQISNQYDDKTTPICICPAHVLLRQDDDLAKKKSVSIQDLANKPMVLLDIPEARNYMMTLFDISARRPKISLRTRSYETVRSAVANGLGFSIVNFKPSHESSPDNPNLNRIPLSNAALEPKIVIIDPYGNNKPAYVKEFIAAFYSYIVELGPDNFSVSNQKNKQDLIFPAPKFLTELWQ